MARADVPEGRPRRLRVGDDQEHGESWVRNMN
jgi:hypothetical protein